MRKATCINRAGGFLVLPNEAKHDILCSVPDLEAIRQRALSTDYYLYVVLNAARQPELYIIHNLAANLQPDERVEVCYLVPGSNIANKGGKA